MSTGTVMHDEIDRVALAIIHRIGIAQAGGDLDAVGGEFLAQLGSAEFPDTTAIDQPRARMQTHRLGAARRVRGADIAGAPTETYKPPLPSKVIMRLLKPAAGDAGDHHVRRRTGNDFTRLQSEAINVGRAGRVERTLVNRGCQCRR